MRAPACIRQYIMLIIHFKDYLLLCNCYQFMHVNKQNVAKNMYISKTVPKKKANKVGRLEKFSSRKFAGVYPA